MHHLCMRTILHRCQRYGARKQQQHQHLLTERKKAAEKHKKGLLPFIPNPSTAGLRF